MKKQWNQNSLLALAVFAWLPLAVLADRPNYSPRVLQFLEIETARRMDGGQFPVVIFDLDETLFNSKTRTLRILRDFVGGEIIREEFPTSSAMVDKIRQSDIRYYLKQTFLDVGIHDEHFLKLAETFWRGKYYSNEYCSEDAIISGAAAFVRSLHSRGAKIVYLTGRDRPDMSECTVASLKHHAFPLDGNAVLIMKPAKAVDDLKFKKEAFDQISAMGVVIGGFENEPANVNAMKERFPEALMVFVDGIHSNRPDTPLLEIPWIKDFKRFYP